MSHLSTYIYQTISNFTEEKEFISFLSTTNKQIKHKNTKLIRKLKVKIKGKNIARFFAEILTDRIVTNGIPRYNTKIKSNIKVITDTVINRPGSYSLYKNKFGNGDGIYITKFRIYGSGNLSKAKIVCNGVVLCETNKFIKNKGYIIPCFRRDNNKLLIESGNYQYLYLPAGSFSFYCGQDLILEGDIDNINKVDIEGYVGCFPDKPSYYASFKDWEDPTSEQYNLVGYGGFVGFNRTNKKNN